MKTGRTRKPLFTRAIAHTAATGAAFTAKALIETGSGTGRSPIGTQPFNGQRLRSVTTFDRAKPVGRSIG